MKIRTMFGASRKPKQFGYTPRYYKPEKNTGGREIQFQRLTSRGQTRFILIYAALLFFVFYLIIYIAGRFNV